MLISSKEKQIYNSGERLIRYDNDAEGNRHRRSYNFFVKLINESRPDRPITIIDLGCGTGNGTKILSTISQSSIIGIDIDEDTLAWANTYNKAENIEYKKDTIEAFCSTSNTFDYIVSRGAIEHVENGLDFINKVDFGIMLLFDVPYNEPDVRNTFHLVGHVTENTLKSLGPMDIYYEDINGIITSDIRAKPNMIMGVKRK